MVLSSFTFSQQENKILFLEKDSVGVKTCQDSSEQRLPDLPPLLHQEKRFKWNQMLCTYNTPTHMCTPEKALGKRGTRRISPVSASLGTAASRDRGQEEVASARPGSSPLAALFCAEEEKTERWRGMQTPDAGGAGSSVCRGLVVLSRSLLAYGRTPFAGRMDEQELRCCCRIFESLGQLQTSQCYLG